MSPAIVLARSSIGHPLLAALQADGATVCVFSATNFVSTQPSPLAPATSAPVRHPLRPLSSFLDIDRHRSGLPGAARSAPNVARFPHSG